MPEPHEQRANLDILYDLAREQFAAVTGFGDALDRVAGLLLAAGSAIAALTPTDVPSGLLSVGRVAAVLAALAALGAVLLRSRIRPRTKDIREDHWADSPPALKTVVMNHYIRSVDAAEFANAWKSGLTYVSAGLLVLAVALVAFGVL